VVWLSWEGEQESHLDTYHPITQPLF
jgi:hypothetical protein